MDERTLHEIYLPAFETAVKKAQPWTVMCSYNRVNGDYASENKPLLTDILRDDWGFGGFVMSDWGAVNDRVKGVAAGLELEMPGSGGVYDRKIIEAVQNGTLDIGVLDKAVARILNIVLRAADLAKLPAVFDHAADHKLAVELRDTEAALAKTSELMGAVVQYAKTRPVFDGYKAARYSRKYLAQHEAELADYRAAKAAMSELLGGAKLPKMDTLKKQHRELSEKKKALYAEYRKAQADMRQAVAVKANIDHLLGHADEQKNKAQER